MSVREFLFGAMLLAAVTKAFAETPTERPKVIVVMGAEGEDEYAPHFEAWAARWQKAASAGGALHDLITAKPANGTNQLNALQLALASERHESTEPLWLVLIGHGTYDNKDAKFNLSGPDLTAATLADWLKSFRRPLAIINTASASGPFLNKLSAPGRVIITATRSGAEQNYSRFGGFFSEAIGSVEADLDKDGQTSLLEAYLRASRKVAEFYKEEGRLATEHPLLDDNGDGLGTPPDWFRGIRAVKKSKEGASLDGMHAHQMHLIRNSSDQALSTAVRTRRDTLEQSIEGLRLQKGSLNEDDYYLQLEKLLLELGEIYRGSPGSQETSRPKEPAR